MSNTFNTTLFIFLNDVEYSLDVTATVESDGIGAYEYWGHKCFDAGTRYCSEFDWKLYEKVSDETYGEIEQYVDDNYESLLERINEEFSI